MPNLIEKKREINSRYAFRQDLIKKILELSVDKILKNTQGQPIRFRDIAEVVRPIMDEYQKSETTRKMLGAQNQADWDSFIDETIGRVQKKLDQQ